MVGEGIAPMTRAPVVLVAFSNSLDGQPAPHDGWEIGNSQLRFRALQRWWLLRWQEFEHAQPALTLTCPSASLLRIARRRRPQSGHLDG